MAFLYELNILNGAEQTQISKQPLKSFFSTQTLWILQSIFWCAHAWGVIYTISKIPKQWLKHAVAFSAQERKVYEKTTYMSRLKKGHDCMLGFTKL